MKKICVFCGSNFGSRDNYRVMANEFGKQIAARGYELVYGGGAAGLMGEVAVSCRKHGGRVTGVIPRKIYDKVPEIELDEIHIMDTMHERKQLMFDLSDAFVALPGGMGTFEEIFEVMTWAQLGYHGKPCAFYNIGGYYDLLQEFIGHSVKERFIRQEHAHNIIITDNVTKLFEKLENYQPVYIDKWE